MRWWRNLWNLKRRRLMSNIVWVILVGNVFGGRCGAEALGLGLMSLNPAYRLTLPPGLAKTNRCLAFDQGRLPDYYSAFITHCSLHFSSTHALSSNSICVISYLSLLYLSRTLYFSCTNSTQLLFWAPTAFFVAHFARLRFCVFQLKIRNSGERKLSS